MPTTPKPGLPTAQDIQEAMSDLTRLYDMREEYARAKKEIECLESSMSRLHMKVWSVLNKLAEDKALEEHKEGGAS